jgi:hypothetical protein
MRGGGDLDFGRDGAWERSRRASGARWMRCFGGAFLFFFFVPSSMRMRAMGIVRSRLSLLPGASVPW